MTDLTLDQYYKILDDAIIIYKAIRVSAPRVSAPRSCVLTAMIDNAIILSDEDIITLSNDVVFWAGQP